ncbi:MAG TPA: C-terminal binding protein, partial [Terriglobales bacterium]|nr:C-terminal binding protein [Terriglobales bacterium]
MKIYLVDEATLLPEDCEIERRELQAVLGPCEVVCYAFETYEKMRQDLKDADGIITGFQHIGDEDMAAMPRLAAISVSATGFDCIDTKAATDRGIPVCAIAEYCTKEVAEHTMALLLTIWRKLGCMKADVEKGGWRYDVCAPIERLEGKTLGIFGLGRIGTAVAKRAAAFGLRVIAADPALTFMEAKERGAQLVTPDAVLATSDIITNHMDANETNRDLFNGAAFAAMARRPLFLNCARGWSVDESALIDALDKGLIRAAGIDVLKDENPCLEGHPLLGRDNVILTPHAAFYSETSIEALHRISAKNLACCLAGRPQEAF